MRARGLAFWTAVLIALTSPAWPTPPNIITKAEYIEPTTRYDHGVLGDAIEWGALQMTVDMCYGCETAMIRNFVIRLPENRVFEDIAPRLISIENDWTDLVMVVETDLELGARLALYTEDGLWAATPFIGTSHRWLAPIGASDLDGDGVVEIAYVDRPHLAKTIRVWRINELGNSVRDRLQHVADLPGFTNHRIGEDSIAGGIRDCADGPELIVTDANWQNIVAVRLDDGEFTARILGPHKNRRSFARALNCQN